MKFRFMLPATQVTIAELETPANAKLEIDTDDGSLRVYLDNHVAVRITKDGYIQTFMPATGEEWSNVAQLKTQSGSYYKWLSHRVDEE